MGSCREVLEFGEYSHNLLILMESRSRRYRVMIKGKREEYTSRDKGLDDRQRDNAEDSLEQEDSLQHLFKRKLNSPLEGKYLHIFTHIYTCTFTLPHSNHTF